jgi:hypothetical protein
VEFLLKALRHFFAVLTMVAFARRGGSIRGDFSHSLAAMFDVVIRARIHVFGFIKSSVQKFLFRGQQLAARQST